MEDIEEAAQRIMERARQRKQLMSAQEGNEENQLPSAGTSKSGLKARDASPSPPPPPLPSAPSPKIVDEDEERRTYRRSRFSALAQADDEFEFNSQARKTKDDYKKGVSPRLSIGETRPSILFSPAGGRSPVKEVKSPSKVLDTVIETKEKRRYQFTSTHESSNDSPLSSVYHETSSTIGAFSSKEVTSYVDGEKKEEEAFGTHTSLKKDTRANTSSSSLLCSPKPFSTSVVNASHSPVRFTPTSSSPIRAEARMNIACTIPLDISSISPANHRTPVSGPSGRNVLDTIERGHIYTSSPSQITPSTAKHFFAQLPSNSPIRGGEREDESSPVRSAALSSAKATIYRKELEKKLKSGEASMPRPAPSSVPSMRTVSRIAVPQGAITPSIPAGVRTQWRGSSNTPVVTGADPSEKTVPDVRATNLASLKSRWEFSAATGTPLHPDKTERDLLDEAKKESEKATYNKSGNTSVTTPRKKGREMEERETNGDARKSLTSSPVGKSPRLNHYRPESMEQEGPLESGEEEDMMEEDEREASRIIDKAFSFMEGQKSPFKSVASLEKVIEQTEDEEENVREEEERKEKERKKKEDDEREEEIRWKKEQERLAREEEELKREKEEREKPKFTAPPPPEASMREEKEEEDDKTGNPLAHSVSFYRKRKAEKKDNAAGHETMDYRMSSTSAQEQSMVIGGQERTTEQEEEEMRVEETRLQQSLAVQHEHVAQARRALDFCSKTQFRGSREEVDAQRALLIATETKRQLMQALDDIRKGDIRPVDGPRGAMRIGPISVQLVRDSMAHADTVYYLIVLLRHGGQLTHTSLVTYDPAARTMGGKSTEVEFCQYLHLERLPPDFNCMVEVWSLCTRREQIGHEDKYKLKGGTMKKKESVFSNLMGGSSSDKQQAVVQTDGRRTEMPSFKMMGRTRLDINSAERRRFTLEDTCHPLEGTIALKIKRYAMEKGDVLHRGFLSLYQRTAQGLGSWTRYWCVVENGEMRFWRCPEDESSKDWLVLIDLSTCASDGVKQEADQDLCPFPNSFHVDVWVPKDGAPSAKQLEKLRVLMAADRKEDLSLWLDILNKTIRNLLLWTTKRNA